VHILCVDQSHATDLNVEIPATSRNAEKPLPRPPGPAKRSTSMYSSGLVLGFLFGSNRQQTAYQGTSDLPGAD